MSSNDLVTVTEAARLLHLSRRAVLHRIAAGSLPAHKLGTHTTSYVLKRSDVLAASARYQRNATGWAAS